MREKHFCEYSHVQALFYSLTIEPLNGCLGCLWVFVRNHRLTLQAEGRGRGDDKEGGGTEGEGGERIKKGERQRRGGGEGAEGEGKEGEGQRVRKGEKVLTNVSTGKTIEQ